MALMDAVNAAIQQLAQHPGVGAGIGFIQADDAGFHEHGGGAVAGTGRAAIHQTAHEFAQLREIDRAMFHFDIDGVVPGARHLHALGIGIDARSKARAVVIDRLAVFPQLDRLVDAARLVVPVHRRRLDILADHAALIDVNRAVEIGAARLRFGRCRLPPDPQRRRRRPPGPENHASSCPWNSFPLRNLGCARLYRPGARVQEKLLLQLREERVSAPEQRAAPFRRPLLRHLRQEVAE